MIGIVVAAHRELGPALIRAAEGIVGPMEGVVSVEFNYEDVPDDIRRAMVEAIASVEDGDGVLILTDMFGGTPTNMSLELMRDGGVEIVAGVNLPLLIKAQAARWERPMGELTEFLKDYGAKTIMVASDYFTCAIK